MAGIAHGIGHDPQGIVSSEHLPGKRLAPLKTGMHQFQPAHVVHGQSCLRSGLETGDRREGRISLHACTQVWVHASSGFSPESPQDISPLHLCIWRDDTSGGVGKGGESGQNPDAMQKKCTLYGGGSGLCDGLEADPRYWLTAQRVRRKFRAYTMAGAWRHRRDTASGEACHDEIWTVVPGREMAAMVLERIVMSASRRLWSR